MAVFVPKIVLPIPVGNALRLQVTFLDGNKQPFDPDLVRIMFKSPTQTDAQATSYSYPDQVTREGVGVYSVLVEVNTKGDWLGWGTGKLPNGMDVTTPKVMQQAF